VKATHSKTHVDILGGQHQVLTLGSSSGEGGAYPIGRSKEEKGGLQFENRVRLY